MQALTRLALAGAIFLLLGVGASAETPLERGKYLVTTIGACGNCHTPRDAAAKPIAGRDRVKDVLLSYRAAFPDMKFKVDDEFGCGDKVVLRWRASGTNTGSLFGIPPTGRKATITGLSVMRVQSDRVVEDWVQEDALGMMQQLGLLPAPS